MQEKYYISMYNLKNGRPRIVKKEDLTPGITLRPPSRFLKRIGSSGIYGEFGPYDSWEIAKWHILQRRILDIEKIFEITSEPGDEMPHNKKMELAKCKKARDKLVSKNPMYFI